MDLKGAHFHRTAQAQFGTGATNLPTVPRKCLMMLLPQSFHDPPVQRSLGSASISAYLQETNRVIEVGGLRQAQLTKWPPQCGP